MTAAVIGTILFFICHVALQKFSLVGAVTAPLRSTVTPSVVNEDDDSNRVYPRVYHMSRKRRDIREGDKKENVMVIKGHRTTMYILLFPNTDLNYGNINVSVYDDQRVTEAFSHIPASSSGPCLFHGRILSSPGGLAAISTCGGNGTMFGVLVTPDGKYKLEPKPEFVPLENTDNNFSSKPHILYKGEEETDSFCGVDPSSDSSSWPSEGTYSYRVRRSGSKVTKVIETAVFADSSLYSKIEASNPKTAMKEIVNRMLGIMNQVQLIYNYDSLRYKFKIVIRSLVILKSGAKEPDQAGGDIDKYLDNFCLWQSKQNKRIGLKRSWDHAIMLTGLDLYKEYNGKKNSKVLGLAWVNGMCRPQNSCTLNEGTSFEAAFVIAHEMGHNFGILHDGSGNNCDSSKYLMSDKTGPGKVNWSPCSNTYLENFINKGYGNCLEDNAEPFNASYILNDSNPGDEFTLDEQCKLSLGDSYRPHMSSKPPFNDVCRELWCASGSHAKPAHPALDGSDCGSDYKCYQGDCKKVGSRYGKASPRSNSDSDSSDNIFSKFVNRIKNFFKKLG